MRAENLTTGSTNRPRPGAPRRRWVAVASCPESASSVLAPNTPRAKEASTASSRSASLRAPLQAVVAPNRLGKLCIIASEDATDTAGLEKRLWDAADQFRANPGIKSQEYSAPVLGLIFLRFAEVRFAAQRAKLENASASAQRGSRVDEPAAYHAEGILYLPAEERFDYLLNRPEAENIGAKVNAAMRDIEKHNPQLAGVLPKTYNLSTSTLLKELLKKVSEIPATLDYDAFGRIYEYFLREFAMSEGQGGGEFYTPAASSASSPKSSSPTTGASSKPCGWPIQGALTLE
jgi:hypothetical protein